MGRAFAPVGGQAQHRASLVTNAESAEVPTGTFASGRGLVATMEETAHCMCAVAMADVVPQVCCLVRPNHPVHVGGTETRDAWASGEAPCGQLVWCSDMRATASSEPRHGRAGIGVPQQSQPTHPHPADSIVRGRVIVQVSRPNAIVRPRVVAHSQCRTLIGAQAVSGPQPLTIAVVAVCTVTL